MFFWSKFDEKKKEAPVPVRRLHEIELLDCLPLLALLAFYFDFDSFARLESNLLDPDSVTQKPIPDSARTHPKSFGHLGKPRLVVHPRQESFQGFVEALLHLTH